MTGRLTGRLQTEGGLGGGLSARGGLSGILRGGNGLSLMVTPEQFGAVGDGAADDTQPIQAAMDAGGMILCSQKYKITSPISLPGNSTVEINEITYSGTDCALLFESKLNTKLIFNTLRAPNGTGIRFFPQTGPNNCRINVFGGSIHASTGIETVSDPFSVGWRGNQELSFFGVTIYAKAIGYSSISKIDEDYVNPDTGEPDSREGWSGEINFYGGIITRYGGNYKPTAIRIIGRHTGLSLYSTSFENSDIYYDIGGSISSRMVNGEREDIYHETGGFLSRLYAYNCRDERTSVDNSAPYPIIIHTNDVSKYEFVSTQLIPKKFDLTKAGDKTFISVRGLLSRNGCIDQMNGFTYTGSLGWYMEPTVYPAYRFNPAIGDGYFRKSGSWKFFPIFGYKHSKGSNRNVVIPNDEADIIKGRGLPAYLYICAGCTLTIGDSEDPEENDTFTIAENSYIMLVPQKDEINLAGRLVHNGLVPVRLETLKQSDAKADAVKTTIGPSAMASYQSDTGYPPDSVVINIDAVQEGDGTPSPENPRPITGWNGATLYHSGADTTNPDEYVISWQDARGDLGPVFGGTFEAMAGALTVRKESKTFAGDDGEGWTKNTAGGYFESGAIEGASTSNQITTDFGNSIFPHAAVTDTNAVKGACVIRGKVRVRLDDMSVSLEEWKTFLAAHPMQVIYPLQTARAYYIEPQQIFPKSGTNNFRADTGNVTVTYFEDTKTYIERRIRESLAELGQS